MSSRWNHSICDGCWGRKNPNRTPIRLKPDYVRRERCCYCEQDHASGIYVRDNPNELPCKGEGGTHES
jgi:hypothetical protein